MQHETQEVGLRELLRHVFASLPECEETPTDTTSKPTPVIVPIARTSEDRSRMKQKVLEELARRQQDAQGREEAASRAGVETAADENQPSLFSDISNTRHCEQSSNDAAIHAVPPARWASSDLRSLVAEAYRSLFRRLPEDHVVLNPRANAEFIVRCRELGAATSEYTLNRTLLNIRKAGWNTGLAREVVAPLPRDTFDHIGHAVEIGASVVQREHALVFDAIPSVDDILCNPELRERFAKYVISLHGALDVVDCHLALLAFRKSGRHSAIRLANTQLPERTLFARFGSLDPADVPEGCGIYRIICKRRPVFVSATSNLRHRLTEHLERGGDALLPEAIPFEINGVLNVEVFEAPRAWQPRRAEAVARSWRIQDYPALNWREQGSLFADSCVVERRAAVG